MFAQNISTFLSFYRIECLSYSSKLLPPALIVKPVNKFRTLTPYFHFYYYPNIYNQVSNLAP
jgi:hypothetical protein